MANISWRVSTAVVLAQLLLGSVARAQAAPPQEYTELETITVTASKLRPLDEPAPTGSRLGLSARDTPATLDLIDADQMLGRGYATIEQATASLTGVTTGGSPGDLADFSMRGFTGPQITLLQDGLYLGPSNMTNRPGNTFNLERIEILKGPSSVLFGQGAIGGAVNKVSRKADATETRINYMVSGGSFGTSALGVGISTPLSDQWSLRADASRTASDGFVDNASGDSLNITTSLVWKPSDDLRVTFYMDYLKDHPSAYFGTPLVPASFATQPLRGVLSSPSGMTLDKRLRFVNYNVQDQKIASRQYWPQLRVDWRISDSLSLNTESYYFNAKRTWINSEVYSFNSSTGLIDRDRFFVIHDQKLFGNRTSLSVDSKLLDRANKFVAGAEYSHLDFVRARGFPDGDSVNPFDPAPGVFGAVDDRRLSPTKWDSTAVFFEDIIELTQQLKLVTGGRFDRLDLDRKNLFDGVPQSSGFTRKFNGSNWRVGLVFNPTTDVTPYVAFSTGQDPAGSNIMLVNRGQDFGLSGARQVEAGVKLATSDNKLDLTASVYDIERKNILTQINSAGDVSNIGSQKSRGLEIAGNARLRSNWALSANLAYTDAKYDRFFDPDFGIEASGNRPANVPKWLANAWTSVSNVAGLPLELGGDIRYVGSRFGDSGNTLKLVSYVLVDTYASYRITSKVMLTGRVNNLFDKAYAQWADVFYPTEVLLGSPRRFEIGIVGQF